MSIDVGEDRLSLNENVIKVLCKNHFIQQIKQAAF